MFKYIKGTIEEINDNRIVLESGNIGYELTVPDSVTARYQRTGVEAKIYTNLYVHEDIICLYGFCDSEELDTFKLLLTVNGIGPKAAISILSIMSVRELRACVATGDAKSISKANGVGKKTAEKLILELKDKIGDDILPQDFNDIELNEDSRNEYNDAVLALEALGYSHASSVTALSKIGDITGMSSSAMIRLALKNI